MKHLTGRRAWIICGPVLFVMAAAWAWHGPIHDKVTKLAAASLPEDMPAFFVVGVDTIAHCSADPDLFRLRVHAELRDAEAPEHYFDLELLGGQELPPTRSAFVALCAKKGLKPSEVGYLPYAVVEWTQRLTIAFAEHRKWPKNGHIRAKCLVYAGILSHYAQDACQPLHTTIHYDGRVDKSGKSPRTGIHARVDALLVAPSVFSRERAIPPPRVFNELLPAVWKQIEASHALVDKVYELDKQIPAEDKPITTGPVHDFASERRAAAAQFSASLYLTAWRKSAKLELPEWHRRPLRAKR